MEVLEAVFFESWRTTGAQWGFDGSQLCKIWGFLRIQLEHDEHVLEEQKWGLKSDRYVNNLKRWVVTPNILQVMKMLKAHFWFLWIHSFEWGYSLALHHTHKRQYCNAFPTRSCQSKLNHYSTSRQIAMQSRSSSMCNFAQKLDFALFASKKAFKTSSFYFSILLIVRTKRHPF